MSKLDKYTKGELVEIASWYGVELSPYLLKADLIAEVEALMLPAFRDELEQPVNRSVRIQRIHDQNKE